MTKQQNTAMQGREVIFEMQPFGNIMKVTAMDTKTLTEITIQAPIAASEITMKNNVLKRLEYVLRKKGHIK